MRQLRNLLAWICLISASVMGLYNGVYKMLYLAIINACMLYDAGVLSATIIAKTVISCLCSPVIICVGRSSDLCCLPLSANMISQQRL